MKKFRILLADDHAIMRMGLCAILGKQPDFEVVGEAEDGEEAVARTRALRPDVVIMDLMMPKLDGAAATAAIHAELPETKILILTTFGAADSLAHALQNGAAGALLKSAPNAELITALRAIAAGRRIVAPDIQRILRENPPSEELTPRQLEILEQMTRGLTNADIARVLGISEPRVKEHVLTILSKLGAANRTEAVALALRKQLLKI